MKIEITDDGTILCDGNRCDPLGLYLTYAECGSSAIINLCVKFQKNLFDL